MRLARGLDKSWLGSARPVDELTGIKARAHRLQFCDSQPRPQAVRSKIKAYLSGPMSGILEHNGPAFEKYAANLRAMGLDVISPHEMDHAEARDKEWGEYIRRDLLVILSQDIQHIYMMPGWEDSRGARLEKTVAEAVGIKVYSAKSGGLLVTGERGHEKV